MQNLKILVVRGGIGGLSAAIALPRNGSREACSTRFLMPPAVSMPSRFFCQMVRKSHASQRPHWWKASQPTWASFAAHSRKFQATAP
ncbi:hypothetical protein EDF59_15114 [Novosphingobium sp. ST904]|nr:hypothetical protein EDF59_15114 [Novosphingobium sp. ST904]